MRGSKLFLFFVFLGLFCLAQNAGRHPQLDDTVLEKQVISEDDLRSYKTDDDFNYEVVEAEESFLDKAYRWIQNVLKKFWESIFGVGTATGFLYFIFRILPYILLAFLVFLLIRFFLKVNSNRIMTRTKAEGSVHFSEEEQIMKNEDIPSLIKDAISQKNYRLAIRYYYLLSLKHLTENERITWQPQKTNEDYIKELSKDQLKLNFTDITRIYDYVWYGEFNIDALKFEALKTPFETLNKSITTS